KVILRKAEFYHQIPALNVAGFGQPFAESSHDICPRLGRTCAEISDQRHCRLLPPRALRLHREQQTAAAEQANELAPRCVGHGLPSRKPLCQLTAGSGCPEASRRSLG